MSVPWKSVSGSINNRQVICAREEQDGNVYPGNARKIAPLAWLPDPLQATGKLALVCEGGGQRGIFTAGVLDEFLKAGFNPFDLLIGTSAGAQNLSAYLCGQRGYARHVITRYTTDKQFFNPLRFIRGGNLIDLDWLISSTSAECPLNIAHALRRFDQGQEFYMCASRADNLDAAYFSPQAEDWLEYIKASSAILDSTVKGWKLTASRITTAASVMRCRLLRHGGGARPGLW